VVAQTLASGWAERFSCSPLASANSFLSSADAPKPAGRCRWVAGCEGADLVVDHAGDLAGLDRAVVPDHKGHRGLQGSLQAGVVTHDVAAAIADVQVAANWPPFLPMTRPVAYSTATPPSGLVTIDQMVTAWPGSSPVVCSVKETPLSVRVRVEVPTTIDGSKMRVTGLVVWVAGRPS
jgi:hypothetical protein